MKTRSVYRVSRVPSRHAGYRKSRVLKARVRLKGYQAQSLRRLTYAERYEFSRSVSYLTARLEALDRKLDAEVEAMRASRVLKARLKLTDRRPLDPEPYAWTDYYGNPVTINGSVNGELAPRATTPEAQDSVHGRVSFSPREGFNQNPEAYRGRKFS